MISFGTPCRVVSKKSTCCASQLIPMPSQGKSFFLLHYANCEFRLLPLTNIRRIVSYWIFSKMPRPLILLLVPLLQQQYCMQTPKHLPDCNPYPLKSIFDYHVSPNSPNAILSPVYFINLININCSMAQCY